MKIQLPNGQSHTLEDNIGIDEKMAVVEDLTKEWAVTIRLNWNSKNVKYFLDSLANYIVWHKEKSEQGYQDKEVLSRKRTEKLSRYKKTSKEVNFSDLNQNQKEALFGETRGTDNE